MKLRTFLAIGPNGQKWTGQAKDRVQASAFACIALDIPVGTILKVGSTTAPLGGMQDVNVNCKIALTPIAN